MDVLRPPTISINGICYRKNPKSLISFKTDEDDENAIAIDEFSSTVTCEEVKFFLYKSASDGRTDEICNWVAAKIITMIFFVTKDEICDAGLDIIENSKGFQISLRIHSAYFKFIIGGKGLTKKRLEMETKTQVRLVVFRL